MRVLDFKGLKCPIPVLKAFKIVKEEKEINEFTFLTNDTSAPKDFKDFCENTGFIIISINIIIIIISMIIISFNIIAC